MNIALEKTEEFVNGVKRRAYGDAFIRGNNGEKPPGCSSRTLRLTWVPVMYISAD